MLTVFHSRGSGNPLPILNRDYVCEAARSKTRTLSAVERLEADKVKYVKSRHVASARQQPVRPGKPAWSPTLRPSPRKPSKGGHRPERGGVNLESLSKLIRDSEHPSSPRKDPCPWEQAMVPSPGIDPCPWEQVLVPSPEKERCPWEQAVVPSPGKERCPWEQALAPSSGKDPCPWEQALVPSPGKERCPWEQAVVPSSGKERCPWGQVPSPGIEGGGEDLKPGPCLPAHRGVARRVDVRPSVARRVCRWPAPSPARSCLSPRKACPSPGSQAQLSDRSEQARANLERFFNRCGLEPEDPDSLASERLAGEGPGSDILSLKLHSVSAPSSQHSNPAGDRASVAISYGISIIERNARVIKWLYSCREARGAQGVLPA
uniref:protein FAM110A-like isoform X2 n=1 Tax=Pristiophorus japonicus TaxID=55135 RepID=UPI00398E7B2A